MLIVDVLFVDKVVQFYDEKIFTIDIILRKVHSYQTIFGGVFILVQCIIHHCNQ